MDMGAGMGQSCAMQYTNLGKTGLKVSRLCIGCMSWGIPGQAFHPWVMDEEAGRKIMRRAIEAGVNFFDTANLYGRGASEEITGRALKDFGRRDEIVLATKAFGAWGKGPNQGGLSRKALMQAVDDSLRRLGMDYIDLYQIHRWDYQTPIEETLEALNDIVRAGKARYIGASSMWARQFQRALEIQRREGWTRFVSMQNFVNLLYREEEREMLPLCRDEGIGVIPWSPLARGRLTRPWNTATGRSESDDFGKGLYAKASAGDRKIVAAVQRLAQKRGVPMAQIALAWLFSKPTIMAPIIGVTRMEQLDEAIGAVGLELTAKEIAALEAPYEPHPVLGHD